jgi:hypothetical protein
MKMQGRQRAGPNGGGNVYFEETVSEHEEALSICMECRQAAGIRVQKIRAKAGCKQAMLWRLRLSIGNYFCAGFSRGKVFSSQRLLQRDSVISAIQ